MKKIKITHILISKGFAGSEKYLCDLIDYQCKFFDVSVIILKKNMMLKKYINKNVKTYQVIDFLKKIQITKIINTYKPDIVHTHLSNAAKCVNKSDKFNIVIQNIPKKYINNSFTNINIHMTCEFPGLLIPLLEKAEEIHLIDVSTSLLIYHLQYKSILSRNLKIYYHSYYRKLPQSKRDFCGNYLKGIEKHDVNWKCNWTIIKNK